LTTEDTETPQTPSGHHSRSNQERRNKKPEVHGITDRFASEICTPWKTYLESWKMEWSSVPVGKIEKGTGSTMETTKRGWLGKRELAHKTLSLSKQLLGPKIRSASSRIQAKVSTSMEKSDLPHLDRGPDAAQVGAPSSGHVQLFGPRR
jgi:hypothetical protein